MDIEIWSSERNKEANGYFESETKEHADSTQNDEYDHDGKVKHDAISDVNSVAEYDSKELFRLLRIISI
jgi:hypothetical protein